MPPSVRHCGSVWPTGGVCICHDRSVAAFRFRLPIYASGLFPDMVYDQLYMEYKLPEGNNYTRVVRDLEEIETYLKGREEITHVTTSIGGTPGRYNLVRSIANPSLSYGELIIDFTSPETLVEHIDEIQAYLSQAYPTHTSIEKI